MYIQFSYGQLKALFTSGKLQKIIMLNHKIQQKRTTEEAMKEIWYKLGVLFSLKLLLHAAFIALVFKFQHSGLRLNVKHDI